MAEEDYWTKIPYPLHISICQRIRSPLDVEDVEQDILLHIWKSRWNFKHKCSFETWARGIAERRIADFFRKNISAERREREYAILWLEERKREALFENIIPTIWAEEILSKLKPIARYIIEHKNQGESFADIAKEVGKTYEATRSHYRRVIASLAREDK
jgi:RNA polymerase sigma factor (sigma-70 family)